MTSRLHPEQPEFESDAERVVWEALRDQLPDGAALFANRRFTDRNGDCEADLIVAWPGVGVAVIEVKGGHVSLVDGVWHQSGRRRSQDVDPVGQARRCRYALRSFLDRQTEWAGRPQVRAHQFVAFPFSHVADDVETTDCPRWMVVDQSDLARITAVLVAALEGDQRQVQPPGEDDVAAIERCLLGRPASQRELVAGEVEAREHVADLLTERQAKVLDVIRELARVEVRGGAGSGKTWLAVEQARRLTAAGQRVGLIAYSRGLTTFLGARVERLRRAQRPAYVGTFHNLGLTWGAETGADDDPQYWEVRLPQQMTELAAGLPESQKFDAFVVDEGQDFDDSWWPALLAGLRDPDAGGLYVFADEGQRVFARQGRPPVHLVAIALDENLRNTKPIAQSFSSLIDRPQRIRGGAGDPVRFVACAEGDALDCANDAVDDLLDVEEWSSEHVALLTTGRRHPIQVERQADGAEEYWRGFWATDDIFYGHVLGFKGLERPAVVLAVNGFGAGGLDRAREKLYVGLSRARDRLVVCGNPALIREVGGEGVARRLGIG